MNDLLNRVLSYEATKAIWRSNVNSIEFQEASKLNLLLFGLKLNAAKKCECIEDLFFMIKKPNILNKLEMEENRQFFLKKGKVIQSFACDIITEKSSDKEMIAALKASPGLIKFFDRFPEDWKSICGLESGNSKKENVVETTTDKVEELIIEETKEVDPIEEMTVVEIREALTALKVKIPHNAKKPILVALLKANQ